MSCIFARAGQYTAQALNSIMDNPTVSRFDAAKNLMEEARWEIDRDVRHPCRRPRRLAIFDVPEPSAAAAISGVVVAWEPCGS